MPRGYAVKTMSRIQTSESTSVGAELARACVKANLPIGEIALFLNVTRATVASWFKDHPIRGESRKGAAIKLTEVIKRDTEAGLLPVKTRDEGVEYLRNLNMS
jgi:hypothetical protein